MGRARCLLRPPKLPPMLSGAGSWAGGVRPSGAMCPEPGLQRHWQLVVAANRGCNRGCTELCRQADGDGAPCPHAVMSCQVSAPGWGHTQDHSPPVTGLLPSPFAQTQLFFCQLLSPSPAPASSLLFLFCSKTTCSCAVPARAIPISSLLMQQAKRHRVAFGMQWLWRKLDINIS